MIRWRSAAAVLSKNRYPIDVVKIPLCGTAAQHLKGTRGRISCCGNAETAGVCTETTAKIYGGPMNRHTQIAGTPSGTCWRQRHVF